MQSIKLPIEIKTGAKTLATGSNQVIYINHVITLNQTFLWSFTLSETPYAVAKMYPDGRIALTDLGSGYINI